MTNNVNSIYFRADDAGSVVTYSFSFQNFDRDYHIGIYAFDESDNKANISNIVGFRIPQPETTVGPSGSTKEPAGPDDTQKILVRLTLKLILRLKYLWHKNFVYFLDRCNCWRNSRTHSCDYFSCNSLLHCDKTSTILPSSPNCKI